MNHTCGCGLAHLPCWRSPLLHIIARRSLSIAGMGPRVWALDCSGQLEHGGGCNSYRCVRDSLPQPRAERRTLEWSLSPDPFWCWWCWFGSHQRVSAQRVSGAIQVPVRTLIETNNLQTYLSKPAGCDLPVKTIDNNLIPALFSPLEEIKIGIVKLPNALLDGKAKSVKSSALACLF